MLCLRPFLAIGVIIAGFAVSVGCQPPQPVPPDVAVPGSPNTTTDEDFAPSPNTTTDEALPPSSNTTGDEALTSPEPSDNTPANE
jgi:hypothetical protein